VVVAAIIITAFIVIGAMKNRFGGFFAGGKSSSSDLIIVNNTSETASSAFVRDGKMISQVMQPGERTSGGRGLIRIFIAKKSGAYEIEYPFPRPAGKPVEISLTQIFDAARRPEMNDELITQKGNID